ADVSDVAGNPATQATDTLTVDETAPTISISTIAGNDILNALERSEERRVGKECTGVEAGQHVTVVLNGTSYDATVTGNAWTTTGPHADPYRASSSDVSSSDPADVSDVAGNPATQATDTLTVDETAPTISISTIAGNDILNALE